MPKEISPEKLHLNKTDREVPIPSHPEATDRENNLEKTLKAPSPKTEALPMPEARDSDGKFLDKEVPLEDKELAAPADVLPAGTDLIARIVGEGEDPAAEASVATTDPHDLMESLLGFVEKGDQ